MKAAIALGSLTFGLIVAILFGCAKESPKSPSGESGEPFAIRSVFKEELKAQQWAKASGGGSFDLADYLERVSRITTHDCPASFQSAWIAYVKAWQEEKTRREAGSPLKSLLAGVEIAQGNPAPLLRELSAEKEPDRIEPARRAVMLEAARFGVSAPDEF